MESYNDVTDLLIRKMTNENGKKRVPGLRPQLLIIDVGNTIKVQKSHSVTKSPRLRSMFSGLVRGIFVHAHMPMLSESTFASTRWYPAYLRKYNNDRHRTRSSVAMEVLNNDIERKTPFSFLYHFSNASISPIFIRTSFPTY
jgi:hypothetical protein